MKMSDVFILPVVAISDGRGGRFIPMESNQQADAAAHAINQHDKLVELNKELVEALGNVLRDICQEDEPNISLVYLAAASGVLRKALELNK